MVENLLTKLQGRLSSWQDQTKQTKHSLGRPIIGLAKEVHNYFPHNNDHRGPLRQSSSQQSNAISHLLIRDVKCQKYLIMKMLVSNQLCAIMLLNLSSLTSWVGFLHCSYLVSYLAVVWAYSWLSAQRILLLVLQKLYGVLRSNCNQYQENQAPSLLP